MYLQGTIIPLRAALEDNRVSTADVVLGCKALGYVINEQSNSQGYDFVSVTAAVGQANSELGGRRFPFKRQVAFMSTTYGALPTLPYWVLLYFNHDGVLIAASEPVQVRDKCTLCFDLTRYSLNVYCIFVYLLCQVHVLCLQDALLEISSARQARKIARLLEHGDTIIVVSPTRSRPRRQSWSDALTRVVGAESTLSCTRVVLVRSLTSPITYSFYWVFHFAS